MIRVVSKGFMNEFLFHLDAFGDVGGAEDADAAVFDHGRGGTDVHAQGRAVGLDVRHAGKDGEGPQLAGKAVREIWFEYFWKRRSKEWCWIFESGRILEEMREIL